MLEAWTDRKFIIGWRGRSGIMSSVLFWLGVVFSVLGIIGVAKDIDLGIGAIPWLLLAGLVFVASMFNCLFWAVGMILEAIESKSKKEK